jgi:Uncharacterised nucleotidyltransferase
MNLPGSNSADQVRSRAWLATLLASDAALSTLPALPAPPAELVQLAAKEEVLSLLAWRLGQVRSQGAPEGLSDLQEMTREAAREEGVASMLFESQTREVLEACRQLDLSAILLKGSALARWAYAAPHLRSCGDVDVLVGSRPEALLLAQQLVRQGFEMAQPSGELVAYELLCTKELAGWTVEVDIHWRLANSPLFNRFEYGELLSNSMTVPDGRALVLEPVHALVHAAIHRALNLSIGMSDSLKWLYDFVAIGDRLTASDWQRLAELAAGKGVAGVVLDGLEASGCWFTRQWPAACLQALELASAREPMDRRKLDNFSYMQRMSWHALPGAGDKARWLWQRIFPSRDYMTYLYGEQGSYATLMWQRLKQAARKLRGKHAAAKGARP